KNNSVKMEPTEVVTEEVKKDAVTSSTSNLEMAPNLEVAPHLENGSLNHAASSPSIASVTSAHSSISNVPQRPPVPVPRAPPRGAPQKAPTTSLTVSVGHRADSAKQRSLSPLR
uniref:Achaete scute target 1 n=1 Tax=Parascaris univalens TaxID=6257 RepID=A0A914ZIY0_PARUN